MCIDRNCTNMLAGRCRRMRGDSRKTAGKSLHSYPNLCSSSCKRHLFNKEQVRSIAIRYML